jgi:hypothetical protein
MTILLLALLIFAGCSSPEHRQRDEIMNRIERTVRLPRGAHSLDEYARYYADAGEGDVKAIYLIPQIFSAAVGDTCTDMTVDGASVEVPCDDTAPPWQEVAAGERRWLERVEQLPSILDGGCGVVEVLFDGATERVERVACNGDA